MARLVEKGISCVQVAGVGDPEEVGNEEQGRCFGELRELSDREEDGDPKENDDDEGGGDLPCSKEDGGPCEIEDELEGKEKGEAGFAELGLVLMPDEGEGDANKEVERGPNGAEEPVGRGARRFVEGGIPGINGAGGDDPSESADEDHDEGREGDFCGE